MWFQVELPQAAMIAEVQFDAGAARRRWPRPRRSRWRSARAGGGQGRGPGWRSRRARTLAHRPVTRGASRRPRISGPPCLAATRSATRFSCRWTARPGALPSRRAGLGHHDVATFQPVQAKFVRVTQTGIGDGRAGVVGAELPRLRRGQRATPHADHGTTRFDAIVIGTGQAGPSSPAASPGRHESRHRSSAASLAAPASTPAASRPRRWSRARMPRIWPAAPPSSASASAAPSRSTWRASRRGRTTISGAVEQRRRSRAAQDRELHGLPGHARFESPHGVSVGDDRPRRRPHLHQRRRPGAGSRHAGHRRRPVPHQQLDDGRRLHPRASRHRRRQLHRPRVRTDVPPLRQRGHHRRDGRRA